MDDSLGLLEALVLGSEPKGCAEAVLNQIVPLPTSVNCL